MPLDGLCRHWDFTIVAVDTGVNGSGVVEECGKDAARRYLCVNSRKEAKLHERILACRQKRVKLCKNSVQRGQRERRHTRMLLSIHPLYHADLTDFTSAVRQ